MSDLPSSEPDWVHGHPHEPNPAPPSADPTIALDLPQGRQELLTVADLTRLPQQQVDGCYVVSTGHGRSGPFRFTGVILLELLRARWPSVDTLHHVDVIAADGFGTPDTGGSGPRSAATPALSGASTRWAAAPALPRVWCASLHLKRPRMPYGRSSG
ncbi:MAG: hypothetical protein IPK16_04420 [Anaerolineales bacterium]|nr:hypothetical protein [Anaerolineales bacterium]